MAGEPHGLFATAHQRLSDDLIAFMRGDELPSVRAAQDLAEQPALVAPMPI